MVPPSLRGQTREAHLGPSSSSDVSFKQNEISQEALCIINRLWAEMPNVQEKMAWHAPMSLFDDINISVSPLGEL